MTTQELYQKTDAFVAKWNGKYIDVDGSFGSQCWDVSAQFSKEVVGCPSLPTGNGYAEGIYRFFQNPLPQYYDRVGPPYRKGDILVWKATFYPPAGHTAVLFEDYGSSGLVFEQDGSKDFDHNGTADYVAYLTTRSYAMVAGALRAKTNGGTTMNPTPKEAGDIYKAFATEKDGWTPGNISQADLDQAIQTPWNKWIYNFIPGVQRLRNIIYEMTKAQTKQYAWNDQLADALGLPHGTSLDDMLAGVNKLKADAGTELTPGKYFVK